MNRVLSGLLAAMVCLGAFAFLEETARAARTATVCPPVGADSDCGTIITMTNAGATVASTGQPPYDANFSPPGEDTLIGVINNTSKPISALGLRSGNVSNGGVFSFDADGIVTFGASGNALDTTGYGGPNAYYTGITADFTGGTVNFITPIAANGGTSYFSLENSISQAHSCADVVNKTITTPTGGGTTITATFTPNFGYTIAEAAVFCGVTDFDWQQMITNVPSPSPYFQVGNPKALIAPPSFNDPPPGGYTSDPTPDNSYPFLYDPTSGELASQETANTLAFSDTPADNCLPGGTGAACGGKTAPAGSKLAFSTHLVGVNADGTALDLGIGFTWNSTFNGTSGGVSRTKNDLPVDPGSGTGSITVTGVQNTTTYQYNGVVVTSVNGNAICPCTVYVPIVVKQSQNAFQGNARPILPGLARPTPTVVHRIPEAHPIGR